MTPAGVTQSIKKQERQIGAPLFERSARTVRLTPLARQLRDDLRPNHTGLPREAGRFPAPGWCSLTPAPDTRQRRRASGSAEHRARHGAGV
ncbi:LysR family transcriptional regulator [Nonomuraea dietziae]|uniref:LysR family transcriptional regulator n=1 Tax=Nonomuraea dietziae TaxID=65515 RepID=UPI0034094D15